MPRVGHLPSRRPEVNCFSSPKSSKILSTTTTTQTGATEQLGCVAPFVASSFSVQGSSLERRVMVGLCYFVACLGSSVLGLLFYKSIQIKSSITTNLLTLGAVSGGCFLWCLPCIHLLRYLQSRECTAHQLVQAHLFLRCKSPNSKDKLGTGAVNAFKIYYT